LSAPIAWYRSFGLSERQFQFEWDESKAAANVRKHGIAFELPATAFRDPQLLTIADLEHVGEERWLSVGWASDGKILSVVYLWSESDPRTTKIRLISARTATQAEIRRYAIREDA
jgi:uncharacterized protein